MSGAHCSLLLVVVCALVAPASAASSDAFTGLTSALGKTFVIVGMGYIMGRTEFVPLAVAKGMGPFIGKVALPALLFNGMATLDLTKVNFTVLLMLLLAKGAVFLFAILIAIGFAGRRNRVAAAGIYAIFATQSNDVAVGLPILQALLPEYADYVFLSAPIQLIILNPIGFAILEASAAKAIAEQEGEKASKSRGAIVLGIVQGVVTNPVVVMTLSGLIINLITGGKLPSFVSQSLALAGSAFSPCSLFSVGVSMVGKGGALKGQGLVWGLVLTLLKCAMLPIVSRYIAYVFEPGSKLAEFAFIFGALPTAPSVPVFAAQYNAYPDVVGGAVVLTMILSAPIIFLAIIIMSSTDDTALLENVTLTSELASGLSIAASLLMLILSLRIACRRRYPDVLVTLLSFAQLCFAVLHLVCVSTTADLGLFAFVSFFRRMSRTVMLLMAINLYLLGRKPQVAQSAAKFLYAAAFVIPLVLTVVTLALPKEMNPPYPCWFRGGAPQRLMDLVYMALVMSVICFSIVATRRTRMPALFDDIVAMKRDEAEPLLEVSKPERKGNEPPLVTDKFRTATILGCEVLNSLLSITLVITQFVNKKTPDSDFPHPSGIVLIQLLFTVLLSDGQGIIPFFVYGFRDDAVNYVAEVASAIRFAYRRVLFGAKCNAAQMRQLLVKPLIVPTPELWQIVVAVRGSELLKDRTFGKYKASLVASELVTWLIDSGHAGGREEAVTVGHRMVEAGLMHHVHFEHDFEDGFFYFQLRGTPPADMDAAAMGTLPDAMGEAMIAARVLVAKIQGNVKARIAEQQLAPVNDGAAESEAELDALVSQLNDLLESTAAKQQ
eukprot:TRINITY_DN851_c0_g2_i1.p1 TRINITY_DN851_c0_g2~~TRINITY_DN851_c0_g2_i1.p1  ORF type:complete len:834 (+),score=201.11 TRINITY_DN851_c0_g2_i1:53-2554(+)